MNIVFILIIAFSVYAMFSGVVFAKDNSVAVSDNVKFIIQLESPVQAKDRAFVRGLGGAITHEYSLFPAMAVEIPEEALFGLSKNPRFVEMEEDVEVQAQLFDNEYAETWSISNVKAKSVHDNGNTGAGVKVGIIDSGIATNHPDLNVVGGYDFVNNDNDPNDVYGHGTHVAGTVCASKNDWGAVGVAPDCELYSLRVLNDNGSGYTSDIIAAVEWAVDQQLDIINLSLGSSKNPGSIAETAYDTAYDAGVLVVAAAGNSGNPAGKGTNTIWPANYSSVISVAATDENNKRASFSSTGDTVELAAPGAGVHSAWNDSTSPHNPQPVCDSTYGCYKDGSGTSMASPQVAGAAAVIVAAGISDENGNGNVNDEVRVALQTSATDLGAAGEDPQYGYGLIDVSQAVSDLGPVDSAPTVIIDEPVDGETFRDVATTSVVVTVSDDQEIVGATLFVDDVAVASTSSAGTLSYEWELPIDDDREYVIRAEAIDNSNQITENQVTVVVDNINSAPIADVGSYSDTYFVNESITFDASGSSDDRGIASYEWEFGDGVSKQGELVNHTYTATGTYVAKLTVTDTDGLIATDQISINIEEEPLLVFSLSVTGYKVKGLHKADLSWSGVDSTEIDVYRDGSLITTTGNDGFFTDNINQRGSDTYGYQLCEAGTSVCSNTSSISF